MSDPTPTTSAERDKWVEREATNDPDELERELEAGAAVLHSNYDDPTPTTSAERACVCCGAVVTRETSPDPWDGRLDAYCEPCAWARCDAYPHDAPRPDLPDKAIVERRYKLLEGPVTVVDDGDEPTRVAYSAESVAALEADQ